jgi:serine/threonine-protein kinase
MNDPARISDASTLEGPPGPIVLPSVLPAVPGYEVVELVGRGGMGKVYRARHVELDRTVAIKVLAHEPDDKALARFRDEARAVAKLQHPNIAQLYDTGTADGRPYFAQEFVPGGTLAQRFAGKPQDPRAAAEVVETLARAIQHSHDHGILHRDLKPGNVLLAADGTPKVTDFGLAKSFDPTSSDAATRSHPGGLTRSGEILGTPSYMPPEQASGAVSSLGPPADVYALGAILYEGLTGRPPFQSPEPLQTLIMVLGMDPVPPRTLLPEVPKDLDTICLKCLEKSPAKRYPTAAELADDLRRFRTGEPIVARPVSFAERVGKWARRNKAQAALVAVSVLFVLAAVAGGVWEAISAVRLRRANDELERKNEELAKVNADLEKSRGETETMLGYALGTMDQYHFTLADKLKETPHGEKLRIEVLKQARQTLDDMYAANPTRERVVEYLMSGYQQLGNALSQTGDFAGAEAAYRRYREAADRLAAAHPQSVSHRAARGTALLQLAHVLDLQGKPAEVDALRDEGEKIAAALDAARPNDDDVIRLNLLALSRSAMKAAAVGTPAAIEPAYRRWVELYGRLARNHPDVPKHRMAVVENELTLAKLLVQQDKGDEADAILARAKGAVDTLPDSSSPAVRKLRAVYHEAVANGHYHRNRPAEADAAYRKALAEYEALAADFPNSPNYRRTVVNTWYSIGSVGAFGGDPAVGRAAYQKARDLAAALVRDYPDDPSLKEMLKGIDDTIKDLPKK